MFNPNTPIRFKACFGFILKLKLFATEFVMFLKQDNFFSFFVFIYLLNPRHFLNPIKYKPQDVSFLSPYFFPVLKHAQKGIKITIFILKIRQERKNYPNIFSTIAILSVLVISFSLVSTLFLSSIVFSTILICILVT